MLPYQAISPESWLQFSQTGPHFLKNHEANHEISKNVLTLGLGPRNYIWANWAHKTYPAISPETWLQFSQVGPHFLKNHENNPIKL